MPVGNIRVTKDYTSSEAESLLRSLVNSDTFLRQPVDFGLVPISGFSWVFPIGNKWAQFPGISLGFAGNEHLSDVQHFCANFQEPNPVVFVGELPTVFLNTDHSFSISFQLNPIRLGINEAFHFSRDGFLRDLDEFNSRPIRVYVRACGVSDKVSSDTVKSLLSDFGAFDSGVDGFSGDSVSPISFVGIPEIRLQIHNDQMPTIPEVEMTDMSSSA